MSAGSSMHPDARGSHQRQANLPGRTYYCQPAHVILVPVAAPPRFFDKVQSSPASRYRAPPHRDREAASPLCSLAARRKGPDANAAQHSTGQAEHVRCRCVQVTKAVGWQ